jgi:hypothetical protein
VKDGDVIAVGANRIQVAIQVEENPPDDSGCGVEYVDPTSLPAPVVVSLIHTDQKWTLREAVTLVGRHEAAAIRLDNERVSPRHAVIFRFKSGPAIFDLGGDGGMAVNGQTRSIAPLLDDDRVAIGPFGLRIGGGEQTRPDVDVSGLTVQGDEAAESGEASSHPEPSLTLADLPAVSPVADQKNLTADVMDLDSQLESVRQDIGESWGRLNSWESQLLNDASELGKQERDLAARAEELDAKDAAIRGQLHDVTRYQEELTQRERELASRLRQLQEQNDAIAAAQAVCCEQEADLARRTQELVRREHVLAQRWTRLQTATCPHCGKPLGTPEGGTPAGPS